MSTLRANRRSHYLEQLGQKNRGGGKVHFRRLGSLRTGSIPPRGLVRVTVKGAHAQPEGGPMFTTRVNP